MLVKVTTISLLPYTNRGYQTLTNNRAKWDHLGTVSLQEAICASRTRERIPGQRVNRKGIFLRGSATHVRRIHLRWWPSSDSCKCLSRIVYLALSPSRCASEQKGSLPDLFPMYRRLPGTPCSLSCLLEPGRAKESEHKLVPRSPRYRREERVAWWSFETRMYAYGNWFAPDGQTSFLPEGPLKLVGLLPRDKSRSECDVPWLYWLLGTSVGERGPLGSHRQPLSHCQVGLSHRSRRGIVLVHKRKRWCRDSKPSGKAYHGSMRGLPQTCAGYF